MYSPLWRYLFDTNLALSDWKNKFCTKRLSIAPHLDYFNYTDDFDSKKYLYKIKLRSCQNQLLYSKMKVILIKLYHSN